MFKLISYCHITKIIVNDYDFNFKPKILITDYDFNFKPKILITNYDFDDIIMKY